MPSDLVQQIIRLHHDGLSRAEIARRLRTSTDFVLLARRGVGIARPAHVTKASLTGSNLADPNRADAKLRKFSWEQCA